MSNVKMKPLSERPSQQPAKERDWLSAQGTFLLGKHRGESLESVARNDPQYLHWIVNSVEDISDEDRQVIEAQLTYRIG